MAKETVESSLVLDAFELARNGRLHGGGAGTIVWLRDDREIARVTWRVEDDEYLHLLYTGARGDGTSTEDFYWLWLDHRPIILPLLHHIGGHYPLEANPIRSD